MELTDIDPYHPADKITMSSIKLFIFIIFITGISINNTVDMSIKDLFWFSLYTFLMAVFLIFLPLHKI